MRNLKSLLGLTAGSVLFALVMLGLAMAPGLLSHHDSTVSEHIRLEARQ